MPQSRIQLKKKWAEAFWPLVGRTITRVRWLTEKEMQEMDWHEACIVLQLDDGTMLLPSRDDEGNGAGALFIDNSIDPDVKRVPEVAPVI
jgi:hypothetical protein